MRKYGLLVYSLLVYSTLAKFKTLPKFEMKKRCVRAVMGFGRKRRSSEEERERFW